MSEIYQTTLTISAVPEGDKVNFNVTDENHSKSPAFVGEHLTCIMLMLARLSTRAYDTLINEFPELENNFKAQISLTFRDDTEKSLEVEGEGKLAIFFGRAIKSYLAQDPDFLEFMNS